MYKLNEYKMDLQYLKCALSPLFQKYAQQTCVQYHRKMRFLISLLFQAIFFYNLSSSFNNKFQRTSFCATHFRSYDHVCTCLRQTAKSFKTPSYHSSHPQNTYFGRYKIFSCIKSIWSKTHFFLRMIRTMNALKWFYRHCVVKTCVKVGMKRHNIKSHKTYHILQVCCDIL